MNFILFPQKFINKVLDYLTGFRPIFLSLFTAVVGLSLVASLTLFDGADNPVSKMNVSMTEKFLLVCLVSPLIESIIFQKFIISFVNKHTHDKILAILLSAAAFASVHNYSVMYVFKMFLAGLLFGLLYLACQRRYPLLYVVTAHALYNLIAMSLDFFKL